MLTVDVLLQELSACQTGGTAGGNTGTPSAAGGSVLSGAPGGSNGAMGAGAAGMVRFRSRM